MSEAVKYASLVGRYIRMERPATADELADQLPDTIGMECTVNCVEDCPDGVVRVHSDYGSSFDVAPSEAWSFTVIGEAAGLPVVQAPDVAELERLREIEAALRAWMATPGRKQTAEDVGRAHQRLVASLRTTLAGTDTATGGAS